MNIRKIISEEVSKIFSENWNSEHDVNAPWNQSDADYVEGSKAQKILLHVIWYNPKSGFALLKDNKGVFYVFVTESFEKDEYSEYADIPREYIGRDEDGLPDFEYGDWAMDSNVVENFVNDNLNKLSFGKGINDYEDGKHIVEIDRELKDELLSFVKYISQDRDSFISILNSIK